MKRMLINATHSEELRVALVDGQKLYDLDIEPTTREQKKANIYKGKVTRVEPSLEAAFVDFGSERHGFLPLKEIAKEYFPSGSNSRPAIKDALKEGQEIILQVEKEERGNKGAAISTFISLAGRYLVLMPNNSRAGGISRRIEGEEREQLREAMKGLSAPNSMGYIVRTAGIGRSSEELQKDLDYLVQLWEAIQKASDENKAPILLHQESDVVSRAIRDYLREDIDEVLIDDESTYRKAYDSVERINPQYLDKIKLYNDNVPLFSRYQVESQIESAFEREVRLPSGGSIVIDPTEALVSIDINSARSTKGGDIEETALNTNLEAADEIARQLRLRDMGGLFVVDFIDMSPAKNQRAVENRMKDALAIDRARVQVGKISRFGLLELSRQRLRPSLGETSGVTCPRCSGQGTIRDIPSTALSVMRLLEEEALKDSVHQLHAQLPVDVATYLLNEKRESVLKLENRLGVRIVVIPNVNLESPHFEVTRIKENGASSKASFEMADEIDLPKNEGIDIQSNVNKQQKAAVKLKRPKSEESISSPSLWQRILTFFAPEPSPEPKAEPQKQAPNNSHRTKSNRKQSSNRNSRSSKSSSNQSSKSQSNKSQGSKSKHNRNDSKRSNKSSNSNAQNDSKGQSNNNQNKQDRRPSSEKKERNEGSNRNRNRRNRNQDNRNKARKDIEPTKEQSVVAANQEKPAQEQKPQKNTSSNAQPTQDAQQSTKVEQKPSGNTQAQSSSSKESQSKKDNDSRSNSPNSSEQSSNHQEKANTVNAQENTQGNQTTSTASNSSSGVGESSKNNSNSEKPSAQRASNDPRANRKG